MSDPTCDHLKQDGDYRDSPALRRQDFCYFQRNVRWRSLHAASPRTHPMQPQALPGSMMACCNPLGLITLPVTTLELILCTEFMRNSMIPRFSGEGGGGYTDLGVSKKTTPGF